MFPDTKNINSEISAKIFFAHVTCLMSNVTCHLIFFLYIFFYIFFQNYSVEGLLSAGSSSFLQYYLVQCNMMLYVSPVQFQEDNLGTYTCQAGNRLGKAETKFIVRQHPRSLPLLCDVSTFI